MGHGTEVVVLDKTCTDTHQMLFYELLEFSDFRSVNLIYY